MKRKQQQGVALVITLILLTVITVIAVAFLAVTNRERASVTETLNTTDAEFAMSAGLERAKGEILGTILNGTNLFRPELRVSMTFPTYFSSNNPAGVDLGKNPNPPDVNNVNFDYDTLGNDFFAYGMPQWRNLYEKIGQNLFFDPRAPVFVNTNRGGKFGPLDYRYYLDLNRNGRFEKSGVLPVVGANGQVIIGDPDDPNSPGGPLIRSFVGDPEWIGILQYPNLFHSHTNRFIARYAYMIVPVGKSLDLNYFGNHARMSLDMRGQAANSWKSGYVRNQGFGTWELNLGAFLTDLNTNVWSGPAPADQYDYRPLDVNGNVGRGFEDATALLHYRYRRPAEAWDVATPHMNLPTAEMMLGPKGNLTQLFQGDLIDAYLDGPFTQFGTPLVPIDDMSEVPNLVWPAGEGKQHFYRPDDFFDRPSQDFPEFKTRMQFASDQTGFYDRYTFYRMLTQLGTDSAPEKDVEEVTNTRGEPETIVNKINLNYQNVGIDGLGQRASASNLVHWTPLAFFSNTAHVLLRQEFKGYAITNIPVFTNGSTHFTNNGIATPIFNPRVRQLLQVAANIYEATTNSPFPCVFHPVYQAKSNGVYIVGFEEDSRSASLIGQEWVDLNVPADRNKIGNSPVRVPVYNIGVIIGARKYLPNFNEFKNLSIVQVSRKIELIRDSVTSRPNKTNQQFTILVTNSCGVELWNSYTNPITSNVFIRSDFDNAFLLTNSTGLRWPAFSGRTNLLTTNLWAGRAFLVPTGSFDTVLEPSTYNSAGNTLTPIRINPTIFDGNLRTFTNTWGLNITNRFRSYVVDQGTGRLLDAVGFVFNNFCNTSQEMDRPVNSSGSAGANVWHRTLGLGNQIAFSRVYPNANDANIWRDYNEAGYNKQMVEEFAAFLGTPITQSRPTSAKLRMDAPFTPVRRMIFTNSWVANDPLVHYMEEDLIESAAVKTNGVATVPLTDTNSLYLGLGQSIDGRYRPWGWYGSNQVAYSQADRNTWPLYDERLKDPMVTQPDDWQFPTQKFPNVGWLGRVHRGTPWQTLYFKSFTNEVSDREWANHAGAAAMRENKPRNDWRLADLFTTAIHPNATRGQLSVNQTNMAAWSAVLSGVGVTTLEKPGNGPPRRLDRFIEPAANEPYLREIVTAINRHRTNSPLNQFFRLSDFLSTPELSSLSPYLNEPFLPKALADLSVKKTTLTDLDYERIPDQILSLVRVGDTRFVVYAYGQSLKPAPNLPDYPSLVTSGPYAGMVINYQITGEMATRSVIRVDFERVLDPLDPDYLEIDYRRPKAVVESFNVLTP